MLAFLIIYKQVFPGLHRKIFADSTAVAKNTKVRALGLKAAGASSCIDK